MSKYKGHIADFPDEVVEWMLAQQEAQGNPRDVSVFEKSRTPDDEHGGFTWDDTSEGFSFCEDVVQRRNFNLFFEKYPKTPENKQALKLGDNCQIPNSSVFDEHRFQAACAAMTGLLNNGKLNHPAAIATEAVELADELLAALKGGTEYQKLKKELERVDKKKVEIPDINSTTYND